MTEPPHGPPPALRPPGSPTGEPPASTEPPILAAFRRQIAACASMGSPFTARVLALLAEDLPPGPIGDRLRAWTGETDEVVPLRVAGALHALALSGADPALAALYPPNDAPDDAPLREALHAALLAHEDHLHRFLDSPPQTNEVARSAALIAAAHWLLARHPLPLRLSELGASAGLNLRFDRYALQAGPLLLGPADPALTLAPDWTGTPPAPAALHIEERRGVDLHPIGIGDAQARLRLRSYVWADQAERLDRLTRACQLPPAPIDAGDAAPWLAARLARPQPGTLHLVFHTVAWQYFPPATQGACLSSLEEAGARATPDAPLAHLAMEGDSQGDGADLALTLWPGGDTTSLGRADFHGRWLEWTAP